MTYFRTVVLISCASFVAYQLGFSRGNNEGHESGYRSGHHVATENIPEIVALRRRQDVRAQAQEAERRGAEAAERGREAARQAEKHREFAEAIASCDLVEEVIIEDWLYEHGDEWAEERVQEIGRFDDWRYEDRDDDYDYGARGTYRR